eukprot:2517638-Rhodomonas_salina.3
MAGTEIPDDAIVTAPGCLEVKDGKSGEWIPAPALSGTSCPLSARPVLQYWLPINAHTAVASLVALRP